MNKILILLIVIFTPILSIFSQTSADSIIYFEGKRYQIFPDGSIKPYKPHKQFKQNKRIQNKNTFSESPSELLISSGNLQLKSVRTEIQGSLIGIATLIIGIATLNPVLGIAGAVVLIGFEIKSLDYRIKGHRKLIEAGKKISKNNL
jgi:hypothetical protein